MTGCEVDTMTLIEWIDAVRANAYRIQHYRLGHDGSDGECDCVGLLIGAMRLAGLSYTHTHGSNYFARYVVQNLQPVKKASSLRLGQAVFKAYDPGQAGWALPSKYASHPDQHDYYHVGVVMSVSPLRIWHCSDGGMHYDSKLGKWRFAGDLPFITNTDDTIVVVTKMVRTVNTSNDGPLNLRESKSAASKLLERIPNRTDLTVLDEDGTWSHVTYNNMDGYVMSKFLSTPTDAANTEELLIPMTRSMAADLYTALGTALKGGVA